MHPHIDPARDIRRLKRLIAAGETKLWRAHFAGPTSSRRADPGQLSWDISFRRFQLAAARHLAVSCKYDPNQPRVPAGNPDGGQWTSGGGHSGFGSSFVGDSGDLPSRDATATAYHADGSLARESGVDPDGNMVLSEFADAADFSDWDERHTVVTPAGDVSVFETSGNVQTIKDADGQVISATAWTSDGPEPQAIVQPAYASPPPVPHPGLAAVIIGGTALYTWMSSRNTADEKAVFGFSADAFVPGGDAEANAVWVGKLSQEEVESACPRYAEVQSITDQSAAAIDRGAYESAATYGTAVHKRIRDEINGPETTPSSPPRDPNFRAEVSLIKSADARYYGEKGSIRVDIYENPGTGTVCVYDVKTGTSGLTPLRALEIASNVQFYYPGPRRIIVTETRPRR